MLELTEDEKKNGWDEKSLEKYFEDREKAQAGVVMFHPDHRQPQKRKWANSLYSPLKWR